MLNFFHNGLSFLKSGDQYSALTSFGKVNKSDPNFYWSKFYISLIELERKNYRDALENIILASQGLKENVHVLNLQAVINSELNRLDKAEYFLKKALELEQNNVDANFNLAKVYRKNKNYIKCLNQYLKLLDIDPKNSNALANLSEVSFQLCDFTDALNYAVRSLDINSQNAVAMSNLARCKFEFEEFDVAYSLSNNALELNPKLLHAFIIKMGCLLHQEKYNYVQTQINERINNYVASDEGFVELLCLKALCYSHQGKYQDALECLIKYEPCSNVDILSISTLNFHKCMFLLNLGRDNEAKTLAKKIPDFIHQNANPHKTKILFKITELDLSKDNYLEGWKNFHLRLETSINKFPLNIPLPIWDGSIPQDNILLVQEQGVGDVILYSSIIRELQENIKNIGFLIDKRLVNIFKNSFPSIDFLTDFKDIKNIRRYNSYLPIASLAPIFRKSISSFQNSPSGFLVPDKNHIHQIAQKLNSNKFNIGLSWQSLRASFGKRKSISLSEFTPIFMLEHINVYNIQYGDVSNQIAHFNETVNNKIITLPDLDITNDFDRLSALVCNLDLVITVCNSTAHLAGALGKKTFVLVPFEAGRFWYWGKDSDKSKWYPSIKIFRQINHDSWAGVVNNLISSIYLLNSNSK